MRPLYFVLLRIKKSAVTLQQLLALVATPVPRLLEVNSIILSQVSDLVNITESLA
jgi:hypothetical protein